MRVSEIRVKRIRVNQGLGVSCEIVGNFNCDFKKSLAPSIKMACDQT